MINKDLVFVYSEDAKVKIKDLASLFKKSSQLMKYSLKVIEKQAILYNPFCIFDYSHFGLILFRVYFKGAYVSEKDKSEILKKLTENNHVVAVYELSGEYDLVVEIQAPNPSRFNKILKNISNLIPTLKHYNTILNLVTHLYPKSYLTKADNLQSYTSQHIIVGGDRDLETFDKKELSVMKVLLNNPKIRYTTLAKKSNLNVKTVKTILNNLHKKNIIKGFKYLIDTENMNINKFRLFLKLHNSTKERENKLLNYFLKTKEITQVNKTLGDWELEIDLESLNKTRIRQLTIEIREQFSDIIENFNIMEFYKEYSKSYLGRFVFE